MITVPGRFIGERELLVKRFRGSPEHDMPQTGRTFVPEVAVVRTAVDEGFHHELEMEGSAVRESRKYIPTMPLNDYPCLCSTAE